jgi:hypothetical protein
MKKSSRDRCQRAGCLVIIVADVINEKNVPDKDDSKQHAEAEDWEGASVIGEITLRE